MSSRTVSRVVLAREQAEGVGARVRRSIGNGVSVDPFLMLDEFNARPPAGFPDHPHRGMMTVTYLYEGAVHHADNKGHAGTIRAGDLQWMCAGRGIVHSEMPATDARTVGLQLWINLRAADKMCDPDYQDIAARDVPQARSPDGSTRVNVLAGECFGVSSPIFSKTPTMYLDVDMDRGASATFEVPRAYNAFVYVTRGEITVGDYKEKGQHGSCFVLSDGDAVQCKAGGEHGAHFVLIGGEPIGEPVVQHGPFVMNTREEIMQAFRDYQAGKF